MGEREYCLEAISASKSVIKFLTSTIVALIVYLFFSGSGLTSAWQNGILGLVVAGFILDVGMAFVYRAFLMQLRRIQ